MGTRYSNGYILIKKDFDDGFIKKHVYKDVVEYWIYQAKKSHIFKLDGTKAKLRNKDDATLKCIIVVDNHYKEEKKNTYIIKGFRFDEKDLDDYLRKTNRSRSG